MARLGAWAKFRDRSHLHIIAIIEVFSYYCNSFVFAYCNCLAFVLLWVVPNEQCNPLIAGILNSFAKPTAPAKCPGYCCTETLGPDSGIIDGTRYCAGCVEDEAEVVAKEENKINDELFSRFGGDA